MKNFRVAKCLESGKIGEYAIFADGSEKKPIFENKEHGKYFYVDNELYDKGINKYIKTSFKGRVKDAVETIRSGNGDCLLKTNMPFGLTSEHVVYFIDRTVGEEIREKFLDGWKDTQFGWAIEVYNKNSMSGGRKITTNGERETFLAEPQKIMCFESEKAARKYVKNLIKRAKSHVENLVRETNGIDESSDENKAAYKRFFESIENETGTKFSVMEDFACDIAEHKNDDLKLTDLGYTIVQIIK